MKFGHSTSQSRSVSAINQLVNAPFGRMIENLAAAIQSAQMALDFNSLKTIEVMADRNNGVAIGRGKMASMLELGMMPSFYYFVESRIDIKLSMTVRRSTAKSYGIAVKTAKPGAGMLAAPVDSSIANKYSYPAGDSCSVQTKLAARPVPAVLSLRLQEVRRKKR